MTFEKVGVDGDFAAGSLHEGGFHGMDWRWLHRRWSKSVRAWLMSIASLFTTCTFNHVLMPLDLQSAHGEHRSGSGKSKREVLQRL